MRLITRVYGMNTTVCTCIIPMYMCTSASSPGKMSQSALCAGTIFDVAERSCGTCILDTSRNAKYTSEMNGNVSTTAHGFEFTQNLCRFIWPSDLIVSVAICNTCSWSSAMSERTYIVIRIARLFRNIISIVGAA